MSSSSIDPIPLSAIFTSHNPRKPCANLQAALADEGYAGKTLIQLVHTLALGDTEQKAEFVRLVEKYENVDSNEESCLVSLAASRAKREIQAILLRDFRSKVPTGYETRYGIVAGERRFLAAAYNHAKHGLPAVIGAQVRKLTVVEAYDLAVAENLERRQMNDMDYARVFHGYRQETNPATAKNWTLKEIAAAKGLDYQFVRSREALIYLPETDQRRIESGRVGKVGITAASKKGLALKRGRADDSDVGKKSERQRCLGYKQVESLFDAARTASSGDEQSHYLKAFAAVLQLDLADALKQSDRRLAVKQAA